MKTKPFFIAGVTCLALSSYEFYASNTLFYTMMEDRNKTNYTAIQTLFFEKYKQENIYHITNLDTVWGITLSLAVLSVVFFILNLIYTDNSYVENKLNAFLKKAVLLVLIISGCIVTFLSLWSRM